MENFFTKHKKSIFILTDLMFIAISFIIAAIFLDVYTEIRGTYYYVVSITMCCVFHCFTFECFKLYNTIWLYASIKDYLRIFCAILLDVIVLSFSFYFMPNNYNWRLILLASLFASAFIVLSRVLVRAFVIIVSKHYDKLNKRVKKNLLIVGAGSSAKIIINDIVKNFDSPYNIVGLIDDDTAKIGCVFSGYLVLGNRYSIPKISVVNAVDEIVIAMPSASESVKKEIINICQSTNCIIKIVPTIYKFDNIESGVLKKARNIEIEDLLARDEIVFDNKLIHDDVKDKVIMVTGGGGSIGSELCRQIAKIGPSKLIIVDIYENNAYDIQLELEHDYPELDIEVLIASVRDESKMDLIFSSYRPYAVFHAAAHKHVPLMEHSPCEAIKNNVFGTYNVARCADKYSVDRFVLISTDKAVNPTNIMGASKRLCEMVIQSIQTVSKTKFVAVRFGNVLGSNGSVIPLFKKQISSGGPITLTHKDITRFFMTIPEAVRLVLQSYSYAKGGEIFVLDMGEPIRIYDLAVNMIKLSGLRVDEDIKIEITGLRPGEKLYEELLMDEEGLKKTAHSKIFVGKPTFADYDILVKNLKILKGVIDKNDDEMIRRHMEEIVPTYNPQNIDIAYKKKSYN